jgi:hypothetical protein
MIFCSSRPRRTTRRIRGRAVKALRSGRSQLCWRGFESHRMQHLFCFFCRPHAILLDSVVTLGLAPTPLQSVGQATPTNVPWSHNNTLQTRPMPEGRTLTKSSLGRASHAPSRQKRFMAVPGFEPGSSGSQPLMLTTTLYHHAGAY